MHCIPEAKTFLLQVYTVYIRFNFMGLNFRGSRVFAIFAFAPSSQPLPLMLKKTFSDLGHPAFWGPKTNERASSSCRSTHGCEETTQ